MQKTRRFAVRADDAFLMSGLSGLRWISRRSGLGTKSCRENNLPVKRDFKGALGEIPVVFFHVHAQPEAVYGGNASYNGQAESAAGLFLSRRSEKSFSQSAYALFGETSAVVLHGEAFLFQRHADKSPVRRVGEPATSTASAARS